MKILAFSDLHRDAAMANAIVSQSSEADVVVGAGDFATCGLGLQDTIAILRRMPVPFVLVPGNHDDLEELRTVCADWRLAHVLHGQSALVNGVTFFGIGYGSGVVNPEPWNRALDEEEATQLLSQCPEHAVLVSHSPPHGIADRQRDGRHDGSVAVRDAIHLRQPTLTICGHIHNGWGQSGLIGRTPIHNIGPRPGMFTV